MYQKKNITIGFFIFKAVFIENKVRYFLHIYIRIKKMKFSAMTYNVCLSIGPPIVFNGAHARAERIADCVYSNIQDVDVIMLQELVVNRKRVLDSFIHHPYQTKKVQSSIFSDNIRFLSSGLAVISKYPIVKQRSIIFKGITYHMEVFMSKGAVYAKIKTPIGFVHVFNTHVNAWTCPKAIVARETQCQQIAAFIKAQDIPVTELVIVGGDLNQDIYEHVSATDTISKMLGGVNFYRPTDVSFSCDPQTNVLVGTDDANEYATRSRKHGCYAEFVETGKCVCCPRQLLDLMGSMQHHLQPSTASFEVVPIKTRVPFNVHMNLYHIRTIRDVSDHYPCVLRMEFPQSEPQIVTQPENVDIDFEPANRASLGWCLTILLFFLAYFFVMVSLVLGFFKIKRSIFSSSKDV